MPKLSLAKLERHLYAAADRLRQEGLDAATYKDYIFGMLFLKRSSDVFDAEREKIVGAKVEQGMVQEKAEAEYGENPDFYDEFFVPERARWTYLQDKLSDAIEPYGSVLDKALAALAEHNDSLAVRDLGWLLPWAETAQECLYLALMAWRVGEDKRGSLPGRSIWWSPILC